MPVQEFVLYDKATGFEGEECIKKHPWLFNLHNVSLERTCNTQWKYLPFKTLLVCKLDKIEDLVEMMNVSPTASFNFNNLGFPRIELD